MRVTRHAVVSVGPEAHPLVTLDEPCTAVSVYVDGNGNAAIIGAQVRVFAIVAGFRAPVGAAATVSSANGELVVTHTGVAADGWDVEVTAASRVDRVQVSVIGYGTEP